MGRRLWMALAAVLCVGLMTPIAFGFDVSADGDRSLNGGANLVADASAETIAPTGTGTSGDPYVYDWDDIDGAGTDASDGLVLGSSKVANGNGGSVTLKLTNGNGKGDITGTSGVLALSTHRTDSTYNPGSAGTLRILGVNDVLCGGMTTGRQQRSSSSPSGHSASLVIGAAADPAGEVRIDYIHTNYYNTADPQGANGWEDARGGSGNLTIYGSGNVEIKTSGGTLGELFTASRGYSSGKITVTHDGAFRTAWIDATAGGTYTAGQEAQGCVFDGDADGDNPDGAFEVPGDLLFAQTRNWYGDPNGPVSITGYTSVSIGGKIDTYHFSAYASDNRAGNIVITGISGDLTIGGAVNLDAAYGTAQEGTLTLACDGTISLGGLDMDKCKLATFDAGTGESYILGELLNLTDPTNGELDAVAGQDVFFHSKVVGNEYLGGPQWYDLAGGGRLVDLDFVVPEPAGIGLFGLALLGLRRRRS